MWTTLAGVVWAVAAIRVVPVAVDGEPVRVVCAVGRPTRVELPEALLRVRTPGRNAAVDFSVERARPEGLLVVTMRSHPSQAVLDVRGVTRGLRVVVESAPASSDLGDVKLHFAVPRETTSVASVATAPPPLRTEAPAAPVATAPPPERGDAPPPFDLLRAKVVVAGDREGLPGQPAMILTDALQGESQVCLRFLLEGGARSRVARVSWEGGEVSNVTQEPQDKDLRVLVTLARDAVTRRAHVSLEIEQGPTYTFAMGARSLKELLR